MRFERDRAALLAIDLQRAFCARDGSIAAQGRDISEIEAAAARALELPCTTPPTTPTAAC
jgi:nicotinamidase-related amidase